MHYAINTGRGFFSSSIDTNITYKFLRHLKKEVKNNLPCDSWENVQWVPRKKEEKTWYGCDLHDHAQNASCDFDVCFSREINDALPDSVKASTVAVFRRLNFFLVRSFEHFPGDDLDWALTLSYIYIYIYRSRCQFQWPWFLKVMVASESLNKNLVFLTMIPYPVEYMDAIWTQLTTTSN